MTALEAALAGESFAAIFNLGNLLIFLFLFFLFMLLQKIYEFFDCNRYLILLFQEK